MINSVLSNTTKAGWLMVSASRHSSYPYVKDYSSPSHSLSMATSAFSRIVCLMVMGAICSTKP